MLCFIKFAPMLTYMETIHRDFSMPMRYVDYPMNFFILS